VGTSEGFIEQYDRALKAGESRWRDGNYRESFVFLNEALAVAKKMKNTEKEVHCSMVLGKLCWASGKIEDSQKFYSDALIAAKAFKLKREMDESQIALRIWNLYPPSNPIDVTVYITATGTKYHKDGCRYLSSSKIPIFLTEACARGYTPCSVCDPPSCPGNSYAALND
jgi:hypothetical protein